MKLLTFKFILIFIYLLSSSVSYAIQQPNLENLVIYKNPKKLEKINFYNIKNKIVNLNKFQNSLVVINFWATWCAPCKEEMPSLDKLQIHKKMNNLRIFPVNVGRDNLEKSLNFYNELRIKNLKVFFDTDITLAKKFGLRGIPTSILLNKDGLEFARIIGSIDYEDIKFINWLSDYN